MARCITCGSSDNRTGIKFCTRCGARMSILASGDVLQNRYKIVRVLGKGGMGAVCLAEDARAHGNHCVVKEMIDYFNPLDPTEVQKAQKRFDDETKTLAELNHNSIPELRESFTEAGRNYMVMTYIEGENLEDALRRCGKPLAADDVIPYAIQVCSVLEYLASRKPPVVHHDIKPANIIVNQETHTLSLVDFGTAKVRPVGGGKLGKGQSSVYGTLGYAPPEQYGENPHTEPRSDVYALGATMYHLLTGDDPGDHPLAFPKFDTLPAHLHRVLNCALSTEVTRRITAAEMRKELERLLAVVPAAQPFVFPFGDRASSAEELARLCDQRWEDARQLLSEGAFTSWLRVSIFRSDLARVAESLKRHPDQDRALEQFIRALDPRLPAPYPTAGLSLVDFGRVRPAQRMGRDIKVRNKTGRGHLSGSVALDPPAPWLAVTPTIFSGNQVTLRATLDTKGQTQGALLTTNLVITSPFGSVERVPVRVLVAFDWLTLLHSTFWLTVLGLALAGVSGYLTGQIATASAPSEMSLALALALAGLGVLSALIIGAIMGNALGGPHRYSRSGCLLWLILAVPILTYLFLAMGNQFQELDRAGLAHLLPLVTAAVGALLFLPLGLFRGLSKAGRAWLRWVMPLLMAAGLAAWALQSGFAHVAITSYQWQSAEAVLQSLARAIPPGRFTFLRELLLTTRVQFPLPSLIIDWGFLPSIYAAWEWIRALPWRFMRRGA